jgi:hypothetical protein
MNSKIVKTSVIGVAKSQTMQFKNQSKSQQGSPEQHKINKKASLLPIGNVLNDRSTSRPPEQLYGGTDEVSLQEYNNSNIALITSSNKTFYQF